MSKRYKTTKKGYLRFQKDANGKLRMQHCLVWESVYGAIPAGMQIHHKDLDKTNNNIENLELVTPLDHKRLHSGCRIEKEEWQKPCKDCGEYKPCTKDHWYFSRGWINGKTCKKCFILKSLDTRKKLIEKGWKRKNYSKKPTQETLPI